jgi:hypothetical protein
MPRWGNFRFILRIRKQLRPETGDSLSSGKPGGAAQFGGVQYQQGEISKHKSQTNPKVQNPNHVAARIRALNLVFCLLRFPSLTGQALE